ncbi:hypothetical protein ACIA8J_32965 [Streptomyces asoensis]|uniref:hypothetical protein n=1 Tax=Streptomyces asoensis TaxID=249586 RepID=UPI0037B6C2FF
MTDPGALIGALGGAFIGALAAIVGPMLVHRRGSQQQQSQDTRSDNREEIGRIISIRTTTRTWALTLERYALDVRRGNPNDLESFDQAMEVARSAAASALDHALYDGLVDWDLFSGEPDARTFLSERGRSRVYGAFVDATAAVRKAIVSAPEAPQSAIQEIDRALAVVERERGKLAEHLLSRVETLAGNRLMVI